MTIPPYSTDFLEFIFFISQFFNPLSENNPSLYLQNNHQMLLILHCELLTRTFLFQFHYLLYIKQYFLFLK